MSSMKQPHHHYLLGHFAASPARHGVLLSADVCSWTFAPHLAGYHPEGYGRTTALLMAGAVRMQVPTWSLIEQQAGMEVLEGYVLRPGQSPASSPHTALPTERHVETASPVVLYRDTNSWCPSCERVRRRPAVNSSTSTSCSSCCMCVQYRV